MRSLANPLAMVLVSLVVALSTSPRSAQADAPPTGCALKGTHPVAKGTPIFDGPTGDRVIGTFSGARAPLTLRELPTDPSTGRARIATSTGNGSVRIEGFVAPSAVAVFTTRDLAVHDGHVWITSGQRVRVASAQPDTLLAELTLLGTDGQTVRAKGACDAFSLEPGTATAPDVPPTARGLATRGRKLDLFDRPNGRPILTMSLLDGTSQVFFSTESKVGFARVQSRFDVAIDAWAPLKDLEPLRKDELRTQTVPTVPTAGVKLALDKPPPALRATKDLPVRAERGDAAKPIGVLETGADFYVMEVVTGWANVMPVGLYVAPPNDGGFWVPASELPAETK